MTRVSIVKAQGDFYKTFDRAVNGIGGRVIARGDCVLIKPNLVEPASPGSGQITNPAVIEAVARYCLDCGASRVIIGEGPSYYQPESSLRQCFTNTGVSAIADRLGIEWILFDEHRYRTFKGVPGCTPDEFRVTEYAFTCDKFINLPVLKTHYLTTVTLAMKNLKGCLKRDDKPRFHYQDLCRAVVELCRIVKPTINVIDGTARTVGHEIGMGYMAEQRPPDSGVLIASSDIVAVDAVGSALIGIDPTKVRTVSYGNAAGLGESDLTRMDIVGEELKQLKYKVKLPQEQLQQGFPLLEIVGAEKACSGCLIPLISNLFELMARDARLEKPVVICLGNNPEVPRDKAWLQVGDCAFIEGTGKDNWVEGCPPSKEALYDRLIQFMTRPGIATSREQ